MKSYYSDPTANTAIARVEREMRRKKKQEEWLRKKEARIEENAQTQFRKRTGRTAP